MTTLSRTKTTTVAGADGPISVRRDGYGIAHVTARSARDAWFGQGFVSAEDRLWQMEYDRLRSVGRWSEAAGPTGLAADRVARKLGLEAAARADIAAMSADTRAMFEAYAAGVNALLSSGAALPPEYGLTGVTPEPWEPWQSVAVFKIRHVLMGLWQSKMALGGLLARVGFETWGGLHFLPPLKTSLILSPGGPITVLFDHANAEIAAAAEHLGFLSEVEAGSNSWVVSGSRTTTGKPVICNDSHRALDVPNAYWQVNLRCPEFNVAGATFAGFPGFPHFGFNGHVAWNITHTQADYQDLYIERFEGADGDRYLAKDGWHAAERRSETIKVRGGEPVTIDCWRTAHGPVVHGDPRSGHGIALKYTATAAPTRAFEGLGATVRATSVEELFEAQ
ncbi:MAG: penicillin acylase family protein, partial [Anaerolineaceae bacterium]